MERRQFMARTALLSGSLLGVGSFAIAETFLTLDQARELLWGSEGPFEEVLIELTKEEMKAIAKASKVRVRSNTIRAWRSPRNHWLILDQIIGKHENIDLAVGITSEGKIQGMEVLTYRESYGSEIRNANWRAQFKDVDFEDALVLGRQIKNISGATLSCSHVTDGINRLTQTWHLVLRHKQV